MTCGVPLLDGLAMERTGWNLNWSQMGLCHWGGAALCRERMSAPIEVHLPFDFPLPLLFPDPLLLELDLLDPYDDPGTYDDEPVYEVV